MDSYNERSERAFQAGVEFAKKHPFSEFAKDRDSERLMRNSPSYHFADVFKYGCLSVWRERGELPAKGGR